MKVIYVIEGIIEGIIALAIIAALVLIAVWLYNLNSMSQMEQIAFNLDKAVNGQNVALLRNFENFVTEFITVIKSMF